MKRILTKLAIFTAILFALTATAQTQFSNEFWISTNATGNMYPNGGTLYNPLDGSTQAKFDQNMNNLPQNSTIHILPGVYQTFGGTYGTGWSPKSGDKIVGSGMDVTVIQLATNIPNLGSGCAIIYSEFTLTNCEISDLTCDGNFNPSENATISGISLTGTRNAIRRVKVKNLGYTAGDYSESFAISLANLTIPISEGNIVEECEVDPLASGHYISGITISGNPNNCCCGIIRNNCVFLTNDPAGAQLAFNGAWDSSVLIEGNYVDGADAAVYGDTGGCTNMIIAHNTFKNCFQGVAYSGYGTRKNITIDFNNFQLAPSTTYGNCAFNLWSGVYPSGIMTNVVIFGNTISLYGPGPANAFVIAAQSNLAGLIFANNTIDPLIANNQAATSSFIPGGNVHMYNNYDTSGNYINCLNIPEIGGVQISSLGLNLISSPQSSTVLANLGLPGNLAAVVTNNQSGVTLNGIFSGDGSGLTNVPATSLTGLAGTTSLPFYIRAGSTNLFGSYGTATVFFSTPVPDTNYVATFTATYVNAGGVNVPFEAWCSMKATNYFVVSFGKILNHPSLEYLAVQKQ